MAVMPGVSSMYILLSLNLLAARVRFGQSSRCSWPVRIRTGQLQREDWPNLTRAASKLSESKIYIDDTPGITAMEMRAKIRSQKADTGIDLVLVDYLRLMSGSYTSEYLM